MVDIVDNVIKLSKYKASAVIRVSVDTVDIVDTFRLTFLHQLTPSVDTFSTLR